MAVLRLVDLSTLPVLLLLTSCPAAGTAQRSRPFRYVNDHLIAIPVRINDSIETDFVLDTGIGINLIATSMCQKTHCKIAGDFTGKRMSGQSVKVPLSRVKELTFANQCSTDVPVGVFDLGVGPEIGGFLSLGYFKEHAFTIDYPRRTVIVEDDESLRRRKTAGVVVPIQIDSDTFFLPFVLPDGQTIAVEVDTGTDVLILNERFMSKLGLSPDAPTVRKVHGQDETGHNYDRYFSQLRGSVHLAAAQGIRQENPKVLFQTIIHDGLVGDSFLRQFIVTYDYRHSQMIFCQPR